MEQREQVILILSDGLEIFLDALIKPKVLEQAGFDVVAFMDNEERYEKAFGELDGYILMDGFKNYTCDGVIVLTNDEEKLQKIKDDLKARFDFDPVYVTSYQSIEFVEADGASDRYTYDESVPKGQFVDYNFYRQRGLIGDK